MAFIKINKQNFYYNLNQIALKTGSVEKIAIVLKDNAYGHGLDTMAKLASDKTLDGKLNQGLTISSISEQHDFPGKQIHATVINIEMYYETTLWVF